MVTVTRGKAMVWWMGSKMYLEWILMVTAQRGKAMAWWMGSRR